MYLNQSFVIKGKCLITPFLIFKTIYFSLYPIDQAVMCTSHDAGKELKNTVYRHTISSSLSLSESNFNPDAAWLSISSSLLLMSSTSANLSNSTITN